MVKKKYNYRFVLPKGKKLYSLVVVKKKNKRQVLVNDVCRFYTVGDYLVYRKYNDSKWYIRQQNVKTETLLGHAQSRVAYFSYRDERKDVISFFNQHGAFVTRSYLYTDLGYFEGKYVLVCCKKDDYYDVFVIKSRVSYDLKDYHLEEFIPNDNITICYNGNCFVKQMKYDKSKKCWKDATVKESWFEKFINWLEKALPSW